MKITNIRIRQLEGSMLRPTTGSYMEERVRRPVDIFPEFRAQNEETIGASPVNLGGGRYKITRSFVQIDTDEGVSGIGGPISENNARFYIDTQLKPLLIGRDPTAHEFLWDLMYRNAINGRKGDNMVAISYVDVALWDLKGKWLGQPVCKLLGGPVQDKLPVYASMSGYSLEPEKVRERMREVIEQGYTAAKWFMRMGAQDGPPGLNKIVEIARVARETAGPDFKLMMDAWNSWDVPFTLKVAERIAEYDFSWIEEPLMPDMYEAYAYLTAASPVPISAGEHEYTRWGFKLMMERHAVDVYQPDPAWCGGITEAVKICTLASAYGFPTPLHASLPNAVVHISFAQNAVVCPIMEYLPLRSSAGQHFFKEPVKPVGGFVYPPLMNGLYELDPAKIENEKDITFRIG
jgi:L-rhamnonate dehydratase